MQTIKLKQRNLNFSIDNLRLLILLFVFILPFISAQSFANGGVGLNATRLVYSQGEESISISARNNTSINYLAKFAITQENGGKNVPFAIYPPLVKVDSKKSQDIRIFIQPHSLPVDRETVFYFTGTMIPSTNGPATGAGINIGYNNIIKLFYRPNNLPISIEDAYKKLVIKSSPSGVVVENNSPYYINLNRLVVGGKKVSLSLQKKNTMIAPYSSYSYTVGGGLNNKQATWVVINDLGGEEKYDGQIL
ncbi:TPA: molecular chaperone [Providencia stuartii]|uniref:Gram-negative pili assembly chaperone domain protein n=4 Tax=Providencia stuartii TaxID=588 RepID=A0AA86YFU8_PROST|nr:MULTISPECIES: molecular chaperone [Providencia]SST05180.1 fimbrial chaperone protein [Acinetobacter baumannii]AFH93535.1 hypothetical protein S70_08360 [Providencia stuartii MRSN 2154]APG51518.1 pilus assembly protein [Providencia stuartii]AVE41285.1 molecular chaperone [Providencia stuartii]AVL38538.1 molecular chaperone [Providencia stuartii]